MAFTRPRCSDAHLALEEGAPFPEPDEELLGVTVNGKLYVMGGWDNGKARGANYDTTRRPDKWTKKSPCRGRPITRRFPR